jgi:hypothetical protein
MDSKPVTLEQEMDADNRIVEEWLLWIIERKQAYLNYRMDILESYRCCEEGVNYITSNQASDPTATKGLKLSSGELQKMGEWIKLIDEVETRLNLKMQLFLQLRREHRFASGRNGWTASVQWRYANELARLTNQKPEDTWIESRNTFTGWWNKIVDSTARLAAKRGLLPSPNYEK